MVCLKASTDDDDNNDDSDDDEEKDPRTPLFPSLTHISFSSRVIRYVADWASVNFYADETVHMIPRLVRSSRFGRPTHLCITMPNGRDMPEFFRRMIKRRPDNITEQTIKDFGDELCDSWEVVRTNAASALLDYVPSSIKTFTVHDLRDACDAYDLHPRQGTTDAGYSIPILFRSTGVTVKVFYNRGPSNNTEKLAPAIAWTADRTALENPSRSHTWEFIGKLPLQKIQEIRKEVIKSANARRLDRIDSGYFDFLPEDDDPEALAAVARAKRAHEDAVLALTHAETAAGTEYDQVLRAKAPKLEARVAELQAAAAAVRAKWEEARSKGEKKLANTLNQELQHAENAAKGIGKAGQEIRDLRAKAGHTLNRQQYVQKQTSRARATRDRALSDLRTAERGASEDRKDNARRRLGSKPAFDPNERITFLDFDEAEPCAVCGGGNVVDRDLNELLERAWSYRI